jgi:hypothetical protein
MEAQVIKQQQGSTLLPQETSNVLKTLNGTVKEVLSASQLEGFEKAYIIAQAAGQLKEELTSEYMKPIMQLQNNRLGFKTDSESGYSESVVKNCLIEAVLTGVQPFGNQFNIIAGNCYITKEGFGHLLSKMSGLNYEIIPGLPRINTEKTSAAIVMEITWSLSGGEQKIRKIDFPIRMNQRMGVDAVIGKATRKARAWLYNTITGMEIGDGDVQDVDANVISSQVDKSEPIDKEAERVKLMIEEAKSIPDLNKILPHVKPEQQELFNQKLNALKP